ncbi:GroES family chaperonin [Demetria terragena]|uniref:GroES family chaperonin n=1 Tax=Demetria terragena TaxID=63959 RepID=UPI000378C779|nr:co-chaperone GroES [Demetria terragena]
MLHDRVLVSQSDEAGERKSGGGIVIPATASVGRRLSWGAVVAIGAHVRQVGLGDRVLFDPEDLAEVELQSKDFLLMRERDIHAVGEERDTAGSGTGLYL